MLDLIINVWNELPFRIIVREGIFVRIPVRYRPPAWTDVFDWIGREKHARIRRVVAGAHEVEAGQFFHDALTSNKEIRIGDLRLQIR